MADEVRSARVPLDRILRMFRPMELDLQAAYLALQQDVMDRLDEAVRAGRTPDMLIEEVTSMFDEAEDFNDLVAKALPRVEFQGIPITIENRPGSVRSGEDGDGHEWHTRMRAPYGFIRGSRGVDGDEVDVFLGPDILSPWVYVIHIDDPETGEYDEDKVVLGCSEYDDAMRLVLSHYDKPGFVSRGADLFHVEEFRKRLRGQEGDPIATEASAALLQAQVSGADGDFVKKAMAIASHAIVAKAVGDIRKWGGFLMKQISDDKGGWKDWQKLGPAPAGWKAGDPIPDEYQNMPLGQKAFAKLPGGGEESLRGEAAKKRRAEQRAAQGLPPKPEKKPKAEEPVGDRGPEGWANKNFYQKFVDNKALLIQEILEGRKKKYPEMEVDDHARARYDRMELRDLIRKYQAYVGNPGDAAPRAPRAAPRRGRDPAAGARAKIGDVNMRNLDLKKLDPEERNRHYHALNRNQLWQLYRHLRRARNWDFAREVEMVRRVKRQEEAVRGNQEVQDYLGKLRREHPKKDWGGKPYMKRIEEDRAAYIADVMSARAKHNRAPNAPEDEARFAGMDNDMLARKGEIYLGPGPVSPSELARREAARKERERVEAEAARKRDEAKKAERDRNQAKMKALITGKGADNRVGEREKPLVEKDETDPNARKALGAGHINAVYKVKLGDVDAVWKPQGGEYGGDVRDGIPQGQQWVRERAGFLVGDVMGLDCSPACVVKELRDGIGACAEFVKNAKEFSGSGKQYKDFPKEQWQRLAVLDCLIHNTDRHGSNFMVVDGDRLVAHDNGLAFPNNPGRDYRSVPHVKVTVNGHLELEESVAKLFTPERKKQVLDAIAPMQFDPAYLAHFEKAWSFMETHKRLPKAVGNDGMGGWADIEWEA